MPGGSLTASFSVITTSGVSARHGSASNGSWSGRASVTLNVRPCVAQHVEEALGRGHAGGRQQRAALQACQLSGGGAWPCHQSASGSTPGGAARPIQPGSRVVTLRGVVEHDRIGRARARQRLAQRAGRQQQPVADAALVEDDDLQVARQAVVLQAVVGDQDVDLGVRRAQGARSGHAVAADHHRCARAAADQQRLVAAFGRRGCQAALRPGRGRCGRGRAKRRRAASPARAACAPRRSSSVSCRRRRRSGCRPRPPEPRRRRGRVTPRCSAARAPNSSASGRNARAAWVGGVIHHCRCRAWLKRAARRARRPGPRAGTAACTAASGQRAAAPSAPVCAANVRRGKARAAGRIEHVDHRLVGGRGIGRYDHHRVLQRLRCGAQLGGQGLDAAPRRGPCG